MGLGCAKPKAVRGCAPVPLPLTVPTARAPPPHAQPNTSVASCVGWKLASCLLLALRVALWHIVLGGLESLRARARALC